MVALTILALVAQTGERNTQLLAVGDADGDGAVGGHDVVEHSVGQLLRRFQLPCDIVLLAEGIDDRVHAQEVEVGSINLEDLLKGNCQIGADWQKMQGLHTQWLGQEKQTLDNHHRQQEESWQKHSQRLTDIVKNNEGVWISTKLFYIVGSLSLLSIITIAIEIAFYVYFHWIQ